MASRSERARWYGTAAVLLGLVLLAVSLGALALRQVGVDATGFRADRVELLQARADAVISAFGTEVGAALDERVHGPAGIAIGGRGPAAIALSIIAEMHQQLMLSPGA